MKACRLCKNLKMLTDFHLNHSKKDGRDSRCKKCVIGVYPKKAYPRNKRYDADPIKRRAQQAVRDAVRKGRLVKPSSCEMCGDIVRAGRLEGHHANGYEDKLSVEWLCRWCHARKHAELNVH